MIDRLNIARRCFSAYVIATGLKASHGQPQIVTLCILFICVLRLLSWDPGTATNSVLSCSMLVSSCEGLVVFIWPTLFKQRQLYATGFFLANPA